MPAAETLKFLSKTETELTELHWNMPAAETLKFLSNAVSKWLTIDG